MEKNQLLPIYDKLAVSFYLYEYKYRNSLLAFYKMIWYISGSTRKENTQPHSSQPFFQYISYISSNFKLDLILGKVVYKKEICNYNLKFPTGNISFWETFSKLYLRISRRFNLIMHFRNIFIASVNLSISLIELCNLENYSEISLIRSGPQHQFAYR